MSKKNVWIVGHKNPDMDSICASITYAYLKNKLQEKKAPSDRVHYIPKRAGAVNAETAYALNYFGHKEPELITDVGTQIKDIYIRRTEGIDRQISMKKAWELMKILNVVTLPVVSSQGKLEGVIVTGDIATSYMDVVDNTVLARARTQYRNIVETLEGKMVYGNEHSYFVRGKVIVGGGSPEMLLDTISEDDLVLIGDREEALLACIEANCGCLVITNGFEISQKVITAAKMRDVVLISTPYDTFTASRLINQSMSVKSFMMKDNLVTFTPDDYIDDVREIVTRIRHRDFPVVDEENNYIGMFSRRNLMNLKKKQLILVDHNEKTQAVANIEEAEILEIIDHHRIGSLETMSPVYFRNQPLGCTATIIYQMYQENAVEIPTDIAGLLCSAILSDTLMFRSPTCTSMDQNTALTLAQIAGIDVETFAEAMFEAGSNFSSKSEEEILNMDFKVFHSGETNFGVSQISAMSRSELDNVCKRIKPFIEGMRTQKNLDLLYVMLTDIRNETTHLVYGGKDADKIAVAAFNPRSASEDGLILRGVVSRKKQLIPELMKALADR